MNITKRIEEIISEYNLARDDEDPTAGGWVIQELKALFLEMSEELIGEDEPYDSRIANTIYHRNDLRSDMRLKLEELLGGKE